MFNSPGVRVAFGLVGGMIFDTIIGLITSAFLTRPNPDEATAL